MESSTSSNNSNDVIFFLRQRPTGSRSCIRLAVVFGFFVGMEMCMLQFTNIAIANCSELARSILKVLGILLMLISIFFMVVMSKSDNLHIVHHHPAITSTNIEPLMVKQEEEKEDDDDEEQQRPLGSSIVEERSQESNQHGYQQQGGFVTNGILQEVSQADGGSEESSRDTGIGRKVRFADQKGERAANSSLPEVDGRT